MHYDVIVVGAGPSGISAAHNLINNKISCCLIDKQVFPRNKLCAGGITNKTYELIKKLNLKDEFNGENTTISNGVKLHLGYKYITDIKCKNSTYLVDRFEFDDYLVNQYKLKGGVLLENTKVKEIDTESSIITLSNGEKISFKYIIGSDGAVGSTRSIIDKSIKSNGFCLQVDISKEYTDYHINNMYMYYGVLPYGYGWIFPKKNHLSVGFIGNYNKDIDYSDKFEKFLSNLGFRCNKEDYKGAFIPFGDYVKNPINNKKNLLLTGDAAGFVDPITGEGIYFAVLSGIKASDAIIKAINEDNIEYIDTYTKDISNIMDSINKGLKLKKLIYNYKKPLFNCIKNEKIGSHIFNNYLFESNYNLVNFINKNGL